MKIRFTKMQAYGNPYIYIDAIHQNITNENELARFVSDKHFGVGSDGMVMICPSEKCDFRMRIFNPDGSEAEMCGNALRSTSKYVYDYGLTSKEDITIETIGGVQRVHLFVEDKKAVNICADIGEPRFSKQQIPVQTQLDEFVDQPVAVLDKTMNLSSLSWGNPHTVSFIDDVDSFDVEGYGKAIECNIELFPQKTNVTFAQVVNRDYIKIREWERNCGETIGCGTGCCTAAVFAMRLGMCNRKVTVHQIGGDLTVEWDEKTNHVFMTGPSHIIFESEIDTDDMQYMV